MKISFVPRSLQGYQKEWLPRDIIAGITLACVGIPEVMGYTSIAQVPIVTGLYTIFLPVIAFALLGSSKLLVVGGDSATAALLASGLTALGASVAVPNTPRWLGLCGLTALVCGVLLIFARLLKLGFIGDFLSASVLVGFLTGVGVQVATSEIPHLLGVAKGSGNWFQQQWAWMSELGSVSWPTIAYATATIVLIRGFKRFVPKIPGAIVAVVLLIIVSTVTNAASYGVDIVGPLTGGLPPIGLPEDVVLGDLKLVTPIALGCLVIIIAQSAATSRGFAMKHGDRADVNRDIVGLAGASLAAGFSGTFAVNGSPTKTQILDSQKGRTQVANLTMAGVVLIVLLFLTAVLTNLPEAVLGGIVFLIGVELIDIAGLRRIFRQRKSEFVIAVVTAVVVFAVGVGSGVILAVIMSLIDVVRRQYAGRDFVIAVDDAGDYTYDQASAGTQSMPGLIVFRYDAELFYANASRFVDQVQALVENAPDPVRWVILDASGIPDIDYSAGLNLNGLLDYLDKKQVALVLARPDPSFVENLQHYELWDRVSAAGVYPNLDEAVTAFRSAPASA